MVRHPDDAVAILRVAERLVHDFPDESEVLRVVKGCVTEFPDADLAFIEHTSRARLSGHGAGNHDDGSGGDHGSPAIPTQRPPT